MATGPIDGWLQKPREPLAAVISPKPIQVCIEVSPVPVKKFSSNPAAIKSRKRRRAAASEKKKKDLATKATAPAATADDSDSDSGDAQSKKQPKLRTHLSGNNGVVSVSKTGADSRIWTPMERSFVLAEMAEYLSRFQTHDGRLPHESNYYSEVAGKLRFKY